MMMSNSDEPAERMISYAERHLAKSLLGILNSLAIGDEIHESPRRQEIMDWLAFFIQEVLEEVDRNWEDACVDGAEVFVAYKIGQRTAKFFGQLYLLACPSLLANGQMYVRVQVDSTGQSVNWFECKLGFETHERRTHNRSRRERLAALYSPDGHEDSTEWSYEATFGTRDE
jgi:hypothetical protein